MSDAGRKPDWLRVRVPGGPGDSKVRSLLRDLKLNTVCQSALCPNMGECFGNRTATFMILGSRCTRNCMYCGVGHGGVDTVDAGEPARIAEAVRELDLKYVVITSVTRDDLDDGGAAHFARTISAIAEFSPATRVEVLIPDFKGSRECLETVLAARPFVLGHNIEVTKRLFAKARPQGSYEISMKILEWAQLSCTSKSGFMLGLGEQRDEILATMRDLAAVADILTIGQYLQPSPAHLSVERFYTPEEFDELRKIGLEMGFRHVESGPLVRSSYHAGEYGAI